MINLQTMKMMVWCNQLIKVTMVEKRLLVKSQPRNKVSPKKDLRLLNEQCAIGGVGVGVMMTGFTTRRDIVCRWGCVTGLKICALSNSIT